MPQALFLHGAQNALVALLNLREERPSEAPCRAEAALRG